MLRLFSALLLLASTLVAAPFETSEPAPLASKSLLLDIAHAGDVLVAVGNRGHVLLSADQGRTWQQSITPTRAMLTGVAFVNERQGWAVGHDGVILATADGGRTWQRQDNGSDLDTVYLDVLFLDARHGFAVGAYGKFMVTQDGGQTWREQRVQEEDMHLNRITRGPDGTLYLAGEAGLVLLSRDQGRTWSKSELPYEGSLYGICPLSGGVLIAYGLRGHILVSPDGGETWQERETEAKPLLMTGLRVRDGVALLGGQGGNFFITRDAGRTFQHWQPADFGTSVADLAVAADGAIVTVGEAGAVRLTLP